jgi:beta-galactosidase GanA
MPFPAQPSPSDPVRRETHGATPISRRVLLSGTAALSAAGLVGRPAIARAAAPWTAAPTVSGAGLAAAAAHTVTFDKYSLMVDGTRLFVWSGEFHPFRLPCPSYWLDILQKMKANGHNAVCMYFNWSYHSSASGVYDFTGIRDMDSVLDMAADTGIYVLARPGPYINGELNAGGFPGWLTRTAADARTDDPVYLAAADQWLTQINGILARHQVTDGSGTVLLYQIENEYANNVGTTNGINYMAHLYAKARADGIAVPIYHNDKGRNGDWTPGSFPTGDNNYLYAFDGYPSASSTPPDWGYYGSGGATGGASASPSTPGFEAEFGGGYFDPWGGKGYAAERSTDNAAYERQFYLTNVANGIKIQNVYMTFGGTSWGWLPASVVYTSYDYGAAITEGRQLTSKVAAMKEMGYFLTSVADIGQLATAAAVTASNSAVKTYHLTNPETGTHFYFARNDGSSDLTFTLPLSTSDGEFTVPYSGTLQLNGKDMKVIVADYTMDSAHLVYTTSHLMTHGPVAGQDLVLLASRPGDIGEINLRYPKTSAAPQVSVLAGSGVTSSWNGTTGDLRLDYTHQGVTRILVKPSGGEPLLVLAVDDGTAASFWRFVTSAGLVLVSGPALVRTAAVSGSVLELAGDTSASTPLEVWAPAGVSSVSWNGTAVAVTTTSSGSLASRAPLAGPGSVMLPSLGGWKYSTENPESAVDFDDSAWMQANLKASFSKTPVPPGQPVLFADDYGFHYGDVWYRGSWSGVAGATAVSLSYQSGQVGMLLAWLDGEFIGSGQISTPTSGQATTQGWTQTVNASIPASSRTSGSHVLSVLVRPMSHQEDGGADNSFKQALGLTSVTFTGASPAVTWLVQGTVGGETQSVPPRGPLNNGGLYGERSGWYLPAFDDAQWASVSLPNNDPRPGVSWYRSTFPLNVPTGTDASLGLTISDEASKSYRAQIFLNGWNVGQYVNGVGPQSTFVLPTGLLNLNSANTLAIAVLAGGSTGGLGSLSLTNLGTVAGGPPA